MSELKKSADVAVFSGPWTIQPGEGKDTTKNLKLLIHFSVFSGLGIPTQGGDMPIPEKLRKL